MSAIGRLLDDFARNGRRPLRIVGASGQLGYGIGTEALEEAMRRMPDMIGCDMGSTDIGPNYLGAGRMATTRTGAKQDLRKVLKATRGADIPLIIGSAGSAGAAPHLDQTLELVREIAREEGLSFTLAWIPADMPREVVKSMVRAGRTQPMEGMPDLTEEQVDASTNLVAQMGMEAFRRALETGADVVIAGRACDTGIFSAIPDMLGFPLGIAVHLAKIVECASLCCSPGGRDSILATLDDEGFELESMAMERAATPASVAAHSLYEQADPFEIREPCGRIDLTGVTYSAVDERRTRVSGAAFEPSDRPMVKLEGARFSGYRAILLAGASDPRFIARQHDLLPRLAAIVKGFVCEDRPEEYRLTFRVYGIDGIRLNPVPPDPLPREIFILGQCIAPTEERAEEVVRSAKQYLLHHGFEGRMSTAGNLAFPFTPPEVTIGPAYHFNIYHLMEADDMASLFPVHVEHIRNSGN